jgi:chromosome segregation ATPase
MSNFNINDFNGSTLSNGVLRIEVENNTLNENFLEKTGGFMTGSIIFTNPTSKVVFSDGKEQFTAFGNSEVAQLADASQSVQYIDCSETGLTKITSNLKVDGNIIINDASLGISKIQNLQTNLNNLSSNISLNTSNISTLQNTVSNLSNIDNLYNNRITSIESYNTQNTSDKNVINGRLTTNENAITGINSNISVIPSISSAVNTLQNTTSGLQTTINMLVSSTPNNQQIQLLNSQTNLMMSSISNLDDSMEVAQQNITDLQELTNLLDTDLASAKSNIQSNTTNITTNTNNITSNTNNITSLTTSLNNLSSSTNSSLTTINNSLDTANTNITTNTNEITNIKNVSLPEMTLSINLKQNQLSSLNRLNMNSVGLGDISNSQLSTLSNIDTSQTIQNQINTIKTTLDGLGDLQDLDISNISTIQTDLTQAKTDITDLKTFQTSTISALSNLSGLSNSGLTDVQNDITDINNTIQTIQTDITDINDTITTNQTNTNNQFDNISSSLSAKQNTINNSNKLDQAYIQVWNGETLAQALYRIDGVNSTQTNNITSLNNSLGLVQMDIETANTNITNHSTSITNLTNSINSLETENTTKTSAIQLIQSDLTQAQLDIVSNNTSLTNSINSLDTSITNNTNSINSINDSITQLNTSLNDKQDTIITLPSTMIMNGSVPLNTVISGITNSISSLQQLQSGDTLSFANIQDNFTTIDGILSQKQNIIDEDNKISGDFVSYDTNTTINTKIDNVISSINNLTSIDTSTLSSISTLSTDLDTANADILNLQTEVQTLQTDLTNIDTDVQNALSTLSTVQNTIDTKQDIITELPISTITNLASSLSTLSNNISSLQNSDITISSNITNLTNSVNSINTSIQNIESDIQNLIIPDPYSSTNKLSVDYINFGTSSLSYVNISEPLQEQINEINNDITANTNSISSLSSNLTTVSSDTAIALSTANNAYDLALTKQSIINNSNKIDGSYVLAPNSQTVVQAINSINSSISTMTGDITTATNTANNAYDLANSKQSVINSSHLLDGSYVQAPNGQNVVQAINSINTALTSLTGIDTSTLSSISDINTTLLDLQDQIDNLPSGGGGSSQAIDIIYNTNSNVSAELDGLISDVSTINTSITTLTNSLSDYQPLLNSTNKLPIENVELENNALSYVDISSSLTQQLLTITNNISTLSSSDNSQTTAINTLTDSINDLTTGKQDLISGTNKISASNVSYSSSDVSTKLDDLTSSINTTNTNIGNLTKSSIGLGNCDNTSDTNKPISSATQTALNLKSDIDNPSFTTLLTTPSIKITSGATNNYVLTSDSQGLASWQATQSIQPSSTVVSSYTTTIPDDCNSIYSYGYTPSYSPYYNPIQFFGGLDNTYWVQCSCVDSDTGSLFFAFNKVIPNTTTNSRLFKYDAKLGKVQHIPAMLSGDINCMVVLNSVLYIGGNFTKYLAMYNTATDAFMNLGGQNGGGTNGIVYGICINNYNSYSTDKGPRIFFCGAFTAVDGNNSLTKVGAFIPTTRQYIQFNSGATQGTVYSICSGNNLNTPNNSGYVIVSGIFTSFGSATATTPPTLNFGYVNCANGATAGLSNLTLSTTSGLGNGYAWSMSYDSANHAIIMGGNFTMSGGVRYLCRYNLTPLTLTSYNFWNNAPTNTYVNYIITGIYNPPSTTQIYITGTSMNSYNNGSTNNFTTTGNTIMYDWSNSTYSNISGLSQGNGTSSTTALSISGDLLLVGQSYGNNIFWANNGYAVLEYNNSVQRIKSGELYEVKSYTINGVKCIRYLKLNTNTYN